MALFTGLAAGAGAIGTAVLGGLGLFGLSRSKKKQQDDPLAGLRAQLQAIAARVPGQVAKRKEQIGATFGEARKAGLAGIGEEIHAERGFGATTLENRLRTELLGKLGTAEEGAMLSAEESGLTQEANILRGTAGLYPTPEVEEPSALSRILGKGAEFATQYAMQSQQKKWLEDILKGRKGVETA